MLGLMVLLVIAAYLVISALVVWRSARWAKNNGRSSWLWGLLAAFVMYNVVFWDLIPTMAVHKYYCSKEAGFWVYKTPEQWIKENPGVAKTLSINNLPEQFRVSAENNSKNKSVYQLPDGTRLTARYRDDKSLVAVDSLKKDGTRGYWLNQRFIYERIESSPFHAIGRYEQIFSDIKTGKPLFRSVNFRLGYGSSSLANEGTLEGWRRTFALGNAGCEKIESPETKFRKNETIFRSLGEDK